MAQLLVQAKAQSKVRNLEQAMLLFQKVLKLEPGHPEALHGLARVELKAGRLQDALARLEELVASGHRTAFVLTDLGLMLQMFGRMDEAEQAYREAEGRTPEAES